MTSLRVWLIGLLALAAAWAVRAWPRGADPGVVGSRYADLDDSESAYRLRLVELSLVSDAAPRRDQFLARGAVPPWPPLVHATLAFGARIGLSRDPSSLELDGYSENDLRDAAQKLGPWLGLAALLAVALAGATIGATVAAPHAQRNGFLAAAIAYAVWPLAVGREVAGSLHAHAWVVILLSAQLVALGVALRARERIDLTLGALVCGLSAALAQLAGAEAWPVSVGVLGVFVVLALRTSREGKRDHWRGVLLFAASAAAVYGIVEPGVAAEFVFPDFSVVGDGLLACAPGTIAAVVIGVALAVAGLWRDRRDPLRAAMLAALFPSLVCALFDRRFFAPLSLLTVCGMTAALFAPWSVATIARRRLVRIAWCSVLVLALASWGINLRRAPERSVAFVKAMHWMRGRTIAPGAFNHPDAAQTWRVASAPRLGGSIAYHARRPVAAAQFDGHGAGDTTRLISALRAPDFATLSRDLALLDCAYLLLSPRMLSDPELDLPANGAVALLALDSSSDFSADFERVYVSARRETALGERDEEGAPSLSLYRRVSTQPTGAPSLSPVGK